ncbi:MAG: ArsR family transcriptional regulator [Dehalococcoidia bacterium]|nr:ArsR family transcriptional regulator [Dehalococcoidia bacterium]
MVQRRPVSTREEVIRLLHEHGPASVAALAERVGVSEGAIRRHMDIMQAEGLVESRLERQGRGRPGLVYSLSVAGEERTAAANYARLLERLYPALESLPMAEVSGASGDALVQRLFEAVAKGVASEYSAHVTASDLPARVGQVAEALSGEGILTQVVDEGDVYRLLNVGCPYRSTAAENHACCEADRRTIELLLEVPVTQTARAVEGASMCEYVVQKGQASPLVRAPSET